MANIPIIHLFYIWLSIFFLFACQVSWGMQLDRTALHVFCIIKFLRFTVICGCGAAAAIAPLASLAAAAATATATANAAHLR